jgi:multicomponent Na+:H+ antiporter subunit D
MIAGTIVAPLLGALVSLLAGRRGPVVAALAAALTLLCTGNVVRQVRCEGTIRHAVGGWGAPLGIDLRADGLAAVMLATFAVVVPLIAVYASGQYRKRSRYQGFFSLSLFGWAALNALVLSADVFNLYVTLELLTLVAVALIVLEGNREALEAGLRYLLVGLLGSLFYLLGVGLLYAGAGTLDIPLLAARLRPSALTSSALSLMTIGLCLKAGLFPLHAWLPPAYVSASAPVSALLSALVGKAPYLVLVRVWFEAFGTVARPEAAFILGVLGAAGLLWGSAQALRQRRLKRVLAYSSLAHVGYLFLVFPLASPRAYAGVVYVAVSHATASASMFVAAGIIEECVGHDDLDGLKGLAHRRPLTFFALGLAGTSLMGLPPSGGFVAKLFLARAALERREWWWTAVVLGGGLLAAGYVFPIVRTAFVPLPRGKKLVPTARRSELVSLALAIAAIGLGLAPTEPVALLEAHGQP